jgi:hypothetical protein
MTSYSQHGEDVFIKSMFKPEFTGLIFEVGACGPFDLSNSRLFIEDGWRAVLVEPSPAPLRALLQEYGNNDRVRIYSGAVGEHNSRDFIVDRFHICDGPLSTNFDGVRQQWGAEGNFIGKLEVPLYPPLYFSGIEADVLSVDTEGNSFAVAIALLEHCIHLPNVLCIERGPTETQSSQHICHHFEYEPIHHEPSAGVNRIFRRRLSR